VTVSFEEQIRQLTKQLTDIQTKQIPFAVSVALNETAKLGQKAVQREMVKRFDRPTPFTIRGVAITRSSKRNLTASVFIKDIQAAYLLPQVEGGTYSKGYAQPAAIRLNKFGNIPSMRDGKKIAALLTRPDTFLATINGVNGVWQRSKRKGLQLLIKFVQSQTYKKRFPFEEIVIAEVKKQFEPALRKSLNKALATAR